MKMCNECYELFDDDLSSKDCPIYKCEGDLVSVDNEIAEIISEMNREFSRYQFPIRTLYTCAGHLREMEFTPYIGFELIVADEKMGMDVADFFSINLFDQYVKSLNEELSKNGGIYFIQPYMIEYSVLPEVNSVSFANAPKYRLFISSGKIHFLVDDKFEKMKYYCELQLMFKKFLINIMQSIKNVDNVIKKGEEINGRTKPECNEEK